MVLKSFISRPEKMMEIIKESGETLANRKEDSVLLGLGMFQSFYAN